MNVVNDVMSTMCGGGGVQIFSLWIFFFTPSSCITDRKVHRPCDVWKMLIYFQFLAQLHDLRQYSLKACKETVQEADSFSAFLFSGPGPKAKSNAMGS